MDRAPFNRPALAVRFTGRGSEYFGIWAVNLLLSVLTLGIYSAWAKVRRNQYLYRHTELAGAVFDYHASPLAILKGRAIAFVAFVVYSMAGQLHPGLAALLMFVFWGALPWLVERSLRFNLYQTSYRGLRFGFEAPAGRKYAALLGWPFLSTVSFGLMMPFAQQRFFAYLGNHSRFGGQAFTLNLRPAQFYALYGRALALLVLGVAGPALLVFGLAAGDVPAEGPARAQGQFFAGLVAAGVAFLLLMWVWAPYLRARLQNLVWNALELGPHRFASTLSARRLAWVSISNQCLIVLTLGLYRPFAVIRSVRCRLEAVSLLPQGSLDDLVAGARGQQGAVGAEMAEMFDVDVSL